MALINPLSSKRPLAIKKVACNHCLEMSEFPRRAMSAFCPHCNKRLVLEDLTIRGFHSAREISTCGDLVVERRGHVVGQVRVANLIVRGKIDGRIFVGNRVNIAKTGTLLGEIEATFIDIEPGAQMNCQIQIGTNGRRVVRAAPA